MGGATLSTEKVLDSLSKRVGTVYRRGTGTTMQDGTLGSMQANGFSGAGGFGAFAMLFGGMVGTLIELAVVLVVLWLVWRWWRSRARKVEDVTLMPSADANRLVLAALVLRGALFRRQLLNQFRNPFRAQAAEPGLDMALLIAAAQRFERDERAFQWALATLTLAALILPGVFKAVAIIGLIGLAMFVRWRERFVLAAAFRRENYNPEAVRARFGLAPAPPVVTSETPVLVSATSNPFIGMGAHISSWNVALDVTRPGPGRDIAPDALSPEGLEGELAAGLAKLNISKLEVREELFVSGVETLRTPGVQTDRLSAPRRGIPSAEVGLFRNVADLRARAYHVAQIADWNRELVFTYAFRCVLRGAMLSVEAVALALGPIARRFRTIDALEVLDWLALVRWGLASLISIPLVVAGAFLSVVSQTGEAIDAAFGGEEGRERKQIQANPAYNYGARWSLREHVADTRTASWFQQSDLISYLSAIDAQILNTLRDRLESAGVDTQAVSQQALVIQNTTVMVGKGGNISGMIVGNNGAVAAAAPAVVGGR